MSTGPAPAAARTRIRAAKAARAAGAASSLLLGGLAVWLVVLASAGGERLSAVYSLPRATAEITRLVVGLPVCAVGVLLLADRFARRAGGVLLAAGVWWILPTVASDVLFVVYDGGTAPAPVAAVVILLRAVGALARPLTVLLLPLWIFPSPFPPRSAVRWRRGLAAGICAVHVGHTGVWALGVPVVNGFISPWAHTGIGRDSESLQLLGEEVLFWVRLVVTALVVTVCLVRARTAPAGGDRRLWTFLALVYPACAFLLLGSLPGEGWAVAASTAGSALWMAMMCLAAARGGLWRLERATSHRLSVAFVLTALANAAVCAAVAVWVAYPAARGAATFGVAGVALVAGGAARSVTRRASLAVERVFYGPRARPHEAARALAVRLREAPNPGDVPEQICRSVVEDLGLSGAVIEVDTRSGPRRLARAGTPPTDLGQVFVLRHHGQTVGRLTVARDGASTPAERDSDLLSLLTDQAGPALAALRLGEEAQGARERLVLAREEERRRLRREIHDGLGPQLAAVQMRLGTAQACGAMESAAAGQLRIAAEGLREALTEVRRITAGLTPAILVESGLLDATRILAHRLSGEDVQVTVATPRTPLPALAPAVETAAYRIVAEAITNAVRHSGARHVQVTLGVGTGALTVAVADDGSGLDSRAVPGTGLASFTERAEEIGGTSAISSGPRGTTVRAVLPVTVPHQHDHQHDHQQRHREGTGHHG
ncbi:histidine kinase [Streptomyces sp. NPDC050804]|uniref:histidine kinase n=1 Tax=Streptomyces sp. NPDC050804 TaxID=3154745 RepID=UPI00344192C5